MSGMGTGTTTAPRRQSAPLSARTAHARRLPKGRASSHHRLNLSASTSWAQPPRYRPTRQTPSSTPRRWMHTGQPSRTEYRWGLECPHLRQYGPRHRTRLARVHRSASGRARPSQSSATAVARRFRIVSRSRLLIPWEDGRFATTAARQRRFSDQKERRSIFFQR